MPIATFPCLEQTSNNSSPSVAVEAGAEFFIKKAQGKFNGWIGYTLSRTERQFDNLNTGPEWFPTRYDRTHDLEVVAIYDMVIAWVFPAPSCMPPDRPRPSWRVSMLDGDFHTLYGDRNGYRMAPYHRMDVSATWKNKPEKKFESSWNVSVYNVYSRKNPYFIYTDISGDLNSGDLTVQAKQVSIFPIIPSITWNFKFWSWSDWHGCCRFLSGCSGAVAKQTSPWIFRNPKSSWWWRAILKTDCHLSSSLTRTIGFLWGCGPFCHRRFYVRDAIITVSDGESSVELLEICLDDIPEELQPLVAEFFGIPVDSLGSIAYNICVYTDPGLLFGAPEMIGETGKTTTWR